MDEIRNYGAIVYLGVFNKIDETVKKKIILNLNGGMWLDNALWTGNVLFLKQYGEEKRNVSFDITLKPEEIPGAYATIIGNMVQTWTWAADSGKHDMGNKVAGDNDMGDTERINLATIKNGDTKKGVVTYTNQVAGESDIVELSFLVERTQ
ncbi:MAG: hypothetical protein HRU12_02260 [Phaeodactylibacter sp.]|nr:hypothetical protein [Phaeodactylibacter sp.]